MDEDFSYGTDNFTYFSDHEAKCETVQMWLNSTGNGSEVLGFIVNFTHMRSLSLSVPVYGYVTPLLLLITLITNSIVVAVLSRPHMKSPTNFILCAMAISDVITLGTPVPIFMYQYTFGYHREPVPCFLAHLNVLVTDIIPTIFHSASVWLTLMLAIQRYIYVCHPTRARAWCTLPRVKCGTIGIYLVATSYNIPRLFEKQFFTKEIPWNCQVTAQCFFVFELWSNQFLTFFYWFRVTCVNCLPCLLLVIFNTLLVISLNKAQAKRKKLISERKHESSKQRDSNCTTMMLVAIVCVFLIVELPLACIVLLVIIQNTCDCVIIEMSLLTSMITFSNLCIALSYIIYFPIYCSMSRQFRETFKEIFIKPKQVAEDRGRNGESSQRRKTYLTTNGPELTCYLSQADDVEFTKTITGPRSTANLDDDEVEAVRETETLL